jgi:hypothetical protein
MLLLLGLFYCSSYWVKYYYVLNIESFDHFGFIIPSSSPLEMIPLSEAEKAYLLNNEQFSKRKQRYLRYRISQKLRRRDAAERGNSSRDA